MKKMDQRGSVGLVIALSVSILLFIGATVFGLWAYSGRQDYKTNADKKAVEAAAAAVKQEDIKKEAEFAELQKKPLKSYIGPETYGKVTIQYPKTWSAVVNEKGTSGAVLDGYFHPDFVPGLQADTNYALRLQIIATAYDQVLKQFDALVKNGSTKVTPYKAPKVGAIIGARLDGSFDSKKKGSMVLLPLRDKTIKIWTESDQFKGDFNNIILANLTFVP